MDKGVTTTEENSVSENGYSGPSRPVNRSFGQKLKAHFKKWWWLHLIIFCAIVLIVVLCIVFVAFPRIAQSGINDSTLEITSLVISDPKPDSIHVVQDSIIRSSSQYHPNLDTFDAKLALAGAAAYGTISLPAVQSGEEVPVHVEQTIDITDAEAFSEYNTVLLGSEEITQTVSGQTWLHMGGLPATQVNYDKSVTMKGFNGLAGFNVTDFTVSLIPGPDGTNMNGTVYIPNPTVLTVNMGTVTFDNFVDSQLIGNSTLENLVLKPGNNTVPMKAAADPFKLLPLLSKYDGKLPIEIVGKSAVYNGENLPYFEEALASNKQHVTLDIGSALASSGVDLGSLGSFAPPS